MKHCWISPLIVCVFFIPAALFAQQAYPRGEQIQVNTTTVGDQIQPSVGVDASGNFFVVWLDSTDVYGQRLNNSGVPIDGEFFVFDYFAGYTSSPAVAVDPNFNAAAVWVRSVGVPVDGTAVSGKCYDANGSTVDTFSANTPPFFSGFSMNPDVAMSANGNYIVVWECDDFQFSDCQPGINGRFFTSCGDPVGGDILVADSTGDYGDPAVAISAGGDFLVVWSCDTSNGSDSDGYSIQARRYNNSATPLGGQFQVNTGTAGDQTNPSVTMNASGEALVVWQDSPTGTVRGQRFRSDGNLIGSEFQISEWTPIQHRFPSAALNADGGFMATWIGGTTADIIRGRQFDSSGNPYSSQFTVSGDDQLGTSPEVASDGTGAYVFTWSSGYDPVTDTSERDIKAQMYETPLFSDGFESGNSGAWSLTIP